MTLKEAVCIRSICKKTSNGLIVNQNHAYMYHCQVQQQLFCSGYKYEDLVLSDLKEVITLSKVHFFQRKISLNFKIFYDQYLAPELGYPYVALSIPRLGKVIEDV